MKEHTVYNPQLVWLDIETTTIEPQDGSILELGITVTDLQLQVQHEDAWIIHFDRAELADVSDWSLQQHYATGLLPACFKSSVTTANAEVNAISWLRSKTNYTKAAVPMCGASIHFDRSWLKVHMPSLEKAFYYGNFDVSTIEKVARWFWPDVAPWEDKGFHRALADNNEAIAELKYYAAAGIVKLGPSKPTSGLGDVLENGDVIKNTVEEEL